MIDKKKITLVLAIVIVLAVALFALNQSNILPQTNEDLVVELDQEKIAALGINLVKTTQSEPVLESQVYGSQDNSITPEAETFSMEKTAKSGASEGSRGVMMETATVDAVEAPIRNMRTDHYSYDRYTFEEASRLIEEEITSFDKLKFILEMEGYTLDFDNDYQMYFYKNGDCKFDPIIQKEMCEREDINIYKQEEIVELIVNKIAK